MSVSTLLLGTLSSMGVRYIFGNPGTTELSVVTACHDYDPSYVVGLSEMACVAMADGYARAQRSLGVVNLHVAPGLGNAMGALYTAWRARTPLLVIVGAQDQRHRSSAPILDGALEHMARPVTKAAFTLTDARQASLIIRQAIRAALTPPMGPVALICPTNLMEHPVAQDPAPVTIPQLGALADDDVSAILELMEQMHHPAMVVAGEVYWARAEDDVMELARRLRSPVYVAPYTGVLPVDAGSPWFAGYLPPNRAAWCRRLAPYDGLMFVGGTGLHPTLYSEGSLPQKKIWLGTDPAVLGSDGEFRKGYVVNIRQALRSLTQRVPPRELAPSPWVRSPWSTQDLQPTHPTSVITSVLDTLANACLVDESGLSTTDVRALMEVPAGRYFTNGSGGIGWGVAAAVGVAFSDVAPEILALVGDGSLPYAAEALWTARHWGKTGIRMVILSNRRYATLNLALHRLTAGGPEDAFTIDHPAIDFCGLATAYGWDYARIASSPDLGPMLEATSPDRNWLIEVMLPAGVVPVTAADHF